MPPAGVLAELDVVISRKNFRTALTDGRQVIAGLEFRLPHGEVGALVGPSGCGKTTILSIIAGLDRDYDGRVRLPSHGRLGVVFQEPRLLPWRTVEQNVRLAAPNATSEELTALFETLDLTRHRLHYPGELSLGLARRVALARAFSIKPDLLLLDEPFVSLDPALADILGDALIKLVSQSKVTTLLVTHNLEEAITLTDRVFLLASNPCRLIAEVPIESPRAKRQPETLARIRAELERVRDQAG